MDEAVMLNSQGFVSEGNVDNILIIKDNILKTPSISDGLLQGLIRDVILQIAFELDITTDETSLTSYDLIQADEYFLTGTGAELIPVGKINQHKLIKSDKTFFPKIAAAFRETVYEQCN